MTVCCTFNNVATVAPWSHTARHLKRLLTFSHLPFINALPPGQPFIKQYSEKPNHTDLLIDCLIGSLLSVL